MLTPADVHHGLIDLRVAERQAALDIAFALRIRNASRAADRSRSGRLARSGSTSRSQRLARRLPPETRSDRSPGLQPA